MCITIFALTRAEWCLCTHAFPYCWENACISIHFHMAWTDMELVTLCLHALLSRRLIWKVCAALCCDNNVHLDLVLRGNWIFFNGGGMNGRREEINSICKQWALLQNRPNLSFLRFQPGFPHRKSLQYLKHLHLLQSDLLTLAVLPVQMDCFHNESWV